MVACSRCGGVGESFEQRIPLLEGIHALYESKLIFHDLKIDFIVSNQKLKGCRPIQKLRRKLNNLL